MKHSIMRFVNVRSLLAGLALAAVAGMAMWIQDRSLAASAHGGSGGMARPVVSGPRPTPAPHPPIPSVSHHQQPIHPVPEPQPIHPVPKPPTPPHPGPVPPHPIPPYDHRHWWRPYPYPYPTPVIWGGGGWGWGGDGGSTVIVQQAAPTQTDPAPAAPTTPAAVEPAQQPVPLGALWTPHDTSMHFNDPNIPSYPILRVTDGGLAVFLDVGGKPSHVRLLGLAPMNVPAAEAAGTADEVPSASVVIDGVVYSQKYHQVTKNVTVHPAIVQNVEGLLKGERVYVVFDEQAGEQDAEGRYAAYLYRAPDGLCVNAEIIRQGWALVDTSYVFGQQQSYAFYEQKACKAAKGFWKQVMTKAPPEGTKLQPHMLTSQPAVTPSK